MSGRIDDCIFTNFPSSIYTTSNQNFVYDFCGRKKDTSTENRKKKNIIKPTKLLIKLEVSFHENFLNYLPL